MKLLKFSLLFAFIAMCHGSTSQGIFKDADHPGKCVYENLVLSPNEEGLPKGQCTRFLCANAEGLGTILGCPFLTAPPSCRLGDLKTPNAPYPACCDKHVICTEEKVL